MDPYHNKRKENTKYKEMIELKKENIKKKRQNN